ncbi:MAG: phosphatase PAP2 family protein [Clostridia bacterium]|nr:phosphatase PAP2 family protein [Clostridia bacterium]
MDIDFLLWLQGLRTPFLDTVLEAVTDTVTGTAMYAVIAILYWCINKQAATFIAVNIASGTMVNQALKNTFCVYRPWIRDPRVVPAGDAIHNATGYSFPSGHTQVASCEFLSVAVWQKRRKWVVALCFFFTLLVMFTRLYLGVHTPQDVLVSLAVSIAVIFMNSKLMKWVDGGKNRDIIFASVGVLLGIAFLLYGTFKSYPVDYDAAGKLLVDPVEMIVDCYSAAGCVLGFCVGWLLERRLVAFDTQGDVLVRVLRGAVGAVILAVLALVVRGGLIGLLGEHWGNLGFFFIAFVYILFLYPLAFTKIERLIKNKISATEET